jgi:hypothetical protein
MTSPGASPEDVTPAPAGADPRTIIQTVLRRAFAKSDSFERDVRAFRNRLVVTTLIAIGTASLLVVLQWRLPNAEIVQRPKDGGAGVARWALLMLVMVFGGVGALVSAIPALAAIPRVKSPFSFPLQQAFMKIAVGCLTGLVGVVVTGRAGVTTGFTSLQALIAVGIVFGAAQQAITQYLDKRAGQIIESTPAPT